ncbi:hypothetical protein A2716_02125 [candidate division WWE3 bacterium RIFCSPHIGHO2_01_FULL_40_23]|uniref:Cytochrome C biogenesis protein transmembrane domain-containing protein n=1 Tax=candidate division WWE3 bacterium RIFCSPLOWO2_01_FULL_41_18 TaxID=1802625 RepID=A0A1F4VF50_UNCKA|nr:MAG: hypothetical protein A2716_02125 [candidate division WWE3 bacterium RIFCSPHIGHO2_01_FULL_40_23]OGC55785.1 MAG: hypothetical protein A3A78_01975 [candidate division WWE3 bacterium RIFCSPLOWO2_01_FULL_41_18]
MLFKRILYLTTFLISLNLLMPTLALAQEYKWAGAAQLSIPIIIGLGSIDAINPCVIGVLLLLLSTLLKVGDKKLVLKNGFSYTAGVYITYLLGGLTLLGAFNAVRSITFISQIFYFVIGAFVIVAGTLEIKDFFWYGRWFSLAIPKRFVTTIEERVQTSHLNLLSAAFFGFIVTLIELPCTGAPYLAILTLMSQQGFGYIKALPLLLLYNLVFVLPLIVIIMLAYFGVGLKSFQTWKQERRGLMRLGIGLTLWLVGIWIITTLKSDWLIPMFLGLLGIVLIMALAKYIFKVGQELEV